MSRHGHIEERVLKALWLIAIGAVVSLAALKSPPERSDPGQVVLFTQTPRFDPTAWVRGEERFPQASKLKVAAGNSQRILAPDFFAAADPELAFDGRSVLFAGKRRREDPWQVWEVPLAGGPSRRITNFSGDCIRPLYLPENGVVYARKQQGAFHLEVLALSGGEPLRLTYAPGNYLPSQVLRDGRVLFEGLYPTGGSGAIELYTVYTDGSGVEAVRCDHGKTRQAARQVASGDLVFVSGKGLGRFTPAHATQLDLQAPDGEIAGPIAETGSGQWLMSVKPKGRAFFGLYEWRPESVSHPALAVSTPMNAVQPVVVKPRQVPPRHPSGLHNRPGGNLLCLNSYESPLTFAESSIGSVRLYAQDAAGKPVLLGQASVESDGSFFVQVPTEQALRIELADRSGRVLAAEKGWFWMRRGEQRICVGCHAGPERAPENAVPKVLARPGVPVQMTEDRGGR